MLVVDVNGDDVNDIIVGNGHGYGLSWIEQHRCGAKREWISHPIDTKGLGIHFALADLSGKGRLDVIAPGKDGLYVYHNQGL